MKSSIRLPSITQLFFALGLFLFLAFSFTAWFNLPIQLTLFIGWFIIIALGLWLGHDYASLEKAAIQNIAHGLGAILILITVGALVGTWIVGGIVPSIIYYGLKIIHPSFFLLATLAICSFTSLSTGTSWGAAATAGIAMMGIGHSLNIPAPLIAGAVLSGVYFGDKISPLSDSVILASSMADVEVIEHIKGMLPIALISYAITAILFTVVGCNYGRSANLIQVERVTQTLTTTFNITPLVFIPVFLILLLLMKRKPAFLVISFGALLGVIWAVLFQDKSIINALNAVYTSNTVHSHIPFIDELLSRGGIKSMLESVFVIVFGLGFGGLLEKVGLLKAVALLIERRATNPGHLSVLTLITAFLGNVFGSAMYVSLILTPGIMMKHYDRLGIERRNLSRNAEFGGTLTCAMVPWSDNGIFMATLLGVPTLAYFPYMWLSFSCILVTVITAYSGKFVDYVKVARPLDHSLQAP